VLDEFAESSVQANDLVALVTRPVDAAYVRSGTAADGRPDEGGVLRFDNVSLAYPSGRVVLSDVSFSLTRGTSLGVVGPSGSGKSTLVSLIVRLRHGYKGSITLDGREITNYTSAELAERVTFIGQESRIFRASVHDNIDLGRGYTRGQIEEAARRAAIHSEIASLPEGYDQLVGELGTTLSGGQRQRICLARALVSRPQILVLDEPTAALDTASENEVERAIENIEGVTKIVIAHRLSTLDSSDEIMVIVDGRIVQHGPFHTLAAEPGTFRQLLEEQDLVV
jgi:ABC-type multidrug transport system fused ATPase/permease subunit